MRDRNVAFIDFANVEDAVAAVEHLNGKRLGDDKLRVDFARAATVSKPKVPRHQSHPIRIRKLGFGINASDSQSRLSTLLPPCRMTMTMTWTSLWMGGVGKGVQAPSPRRGGQTPE